MIGGAKPVPVNPYNLRYPVRDDILVTLAGPGMNLLLAIVIIGAARIASVFGSVEVVHVFGEAAHLSLALCFFNLLVPIPPLDGSQVIRALVGMSHEHYARLGVWVPAGHRFLAISFCPGPGYNVTDATFGLIAVCFGFAVG